jgi:hypothetical protein
METAAHLQVQLVLSAESFSSGMRDSSCHVHGRPDLESRLTLED